MTGLKSIKSLAPWFALFALVGQAAIVAYRNAAQEIPLRVPSNSGSGESFAFDTSEPLRGDSASWFFLRAVEIPTSQVEALELDAYISRIYRRIGGQRVRDVTIFFAQTGEARAMAGHHPPRCYPSSGWELLEDDTVDLDVLRTDGKVIHSRMYHFVSLLDRQLSLWVVNGFVLPDGRVVRSLDETASISGRVAESSRGLVQFQLLFEGDHKFVDISDDAESLLRALPADCFSDFGRRDPRDGLDSMSGMVK